MVSRTRWPTMEAALVFGRRRGYDDRVMPSATPTSRSKSLTPSAVRFRMFGVIALASTLLMGVAQGQEKTTFSATVLDADCLGGYQVSVADVMGDGKPEVLTLGRTVRRLENGDWKAFPITGKQTQDNIDLAPYDIDGDGLVDLAVASDFVLEHPERGKLQWMRRNNDLKQEWQLIPIADVPSIHRIRWANVDGAGHKVLVTRRCWGKPPGGRRSMASAPGSVFFAFPMTRSTITGPRN